MKTIHIDEIIKSVRKMCIDANYYLPEDVKNKIKEKRSEETFPVAKGVLDQIVENFEIAETRDVPMCQDTGMACIFVELGQEVSIEGGFIEDAINEGVRQGYRDGFLRKSVVGDPLNRKNTGDNTPAVITYKITKGDALKIVVAPKGFGSENMSRVKMLKPSEGLDGVVAFILETVVLAGPNPCPPIVVGVGIGGTIDKATSIAKQSLLRPMDEINPDPYYATLEKELLDKINALGIGPQGFGGKTTALAVNIEVYPTHIAGLPVAVNIQCHAARHAEVIL